MAMENIYDISSNASDRSPFFSRRSRSLYLLCRSLKLSQKTRCTILMYLGQEDCPPSTFGLFANHATKLLNLSCLFLAAILLTEKSVALSSRLQRNYLFKKYLNTLRFCGKWSNFNRRQWHCLQMQSETAWTLKSSFVSAVVIEHRPLLTLYQKSLLIFLYILKQFIYLNSDAELKITQKNGPSFTDSFISITFTLTRAALQKNIFSLFCMN